MTTGEISDPQVRVTTAQREHAIELLRNAAADGRLSFDELEARVPQALNAVTRGQLAAVLDDLVRAADLDTEVGSAEPIADEVGYQWDRPLLIKGEGMWSSVERQGVWTAPPFMELITKGVARLDFQHAHVPVKLIDLVLVATGWSTVTLIVPEGWGVDTNAVQTLQNATMATSVPTRPDDGFPRIVARGRAAAGLTVRTPKPRDLRRAAKALGTERRAITS